MQYITNFLKLLFLSKTFRNTFLVFLGNGISAFFSFLFTVTLVRQLSLADFGYFSALLSLLFLVTDLSDIGVGSSLSAFLPPMEKTVSKLLSFLKTAFTIQVTIASVVSLLILVFSKNIAVVLFHGLELHGLVKITALGIFTTIMVNFFQFSLSARQRFLQVSFLSSFGSLMRLLLLLVLLVFAAVTLENAVYMQTAAFILLLTMAVILLKLDFINEKIITTDFKKLLSFAYLLGIARGLTALASRLDVLMIIAIKNATEAGIYSTASRVISIYPLLSGSFSTVIAPRLSATTDKKELKTYMYKVILATLGIIVIIVLMMVTAYPFMTVLFGQKAVPAVPVFRYLLLSMIFFVGSIPAVSLAIYYLKKPYILTVNSVLQLVIVVVGNYIFIPRYGRLGASYSLIIAYGVSLLLTSYLAYYHLRIKDV